MGTRRTRREFLGNVGQGMLVASVGFGTALDMGLSPAWAKDDGGGERLAFGGLEPLVGLMQETPVRNLVPVLVEKLRAGTELKEFVARNVGSYWHPVGTCAMGVHKEAVVDPLLHVYGTTKLRVADASIMPNITSGNTNAPTIVIAQRAAQMIMGARKEAHPSNRSLLTSASRLS